MIEPLAPPQLVTKVGMPTVMAHRRAVLPCGCAAYVGIRIDTMEVTVAIKACRHEHEELAEHFRLLYRVSLVAPSDRPAIDVADELLEQTARAWRAAA